MYSELKKSKGTYQRYFLAGFVDGEGSFNISFSKHPTSPSGWIILPKFQIYQHQNHREILEFFQGLLGAGRIDKKSGSDVLSLTIEVRQTIIEKVLPFFRRYPLAVKADTFQKFSTVVYMMERGEHLQYQGFERIVRLAHSMNAEGRFRIYSQEYVLETAKNNFKQKTH